MFNSSLDKKSLKLEKETREENCIGNKTSGLKTSQTRKGYREEN